MGKTTGPLPALREPRNQTQGQDSDLPDGSRRIAQTPAEVRLQVVEEQLHLGARFTFRPTVPGIRDLRMHTGPIEGRTEIAAFYIPPAAGGIVNVDAEITVSIVLNEGRGLWPDDQVPLLHDLLVSMFEWIGLRVLPPLVPFL